jgi:hypothetical protein
LLRIKRAISREATTSMTSPKNQQKPKEKNRKQVARLRCEVEQEDGYADKLSAECCD